MNYDDEAQKVRRCLKHWQEQRVWAETPKDVAEAERAIQFHKVRWLAICEKARDAAGGAPELELGRNVLGIFQFSERASRGEGVGWEVLGRELIKLVLRSKR